MVHVDATRCKSRNWSAWGLSKGGREDALCEAAADALDADEPEDERERERAAVAPAVEEAHCGLEREREEHEGLDDGREGQERGGEWRQAQGERRAGEKDGGLVDELREGERVCGSGGGTGEGAV